EFRRVLFRSPEACADAFAAYFSWRAPRQREEAEIPYPLFDHPFELFAAVGIPVVEQALACAPEFAHSIPYPVAVKVMDVDHKTEAGGLALGIAGRVDFEARIRQFGKERLVVKNMDSGLAEAIVGQPYHPVVR